MPATKAEIQGEMVEEPTAALHPPSAMDDELRAELDRRWQQHLADPSQARPAEQVIEEIRRKYRCHG